MSTGAQPANQQEKAFAEFPKPLQCGKLPVFRPFSAILRAVRANCASRPPGWKCAASRAERMAGMQIRSVFSRGALRIVQN